MFTEHEKNTFGHYIYIVIFSVQFLVQSTTMYSFNFFVNSLSWNCFSVFLKRKWLKAIFFMTKSARIWTQVKNRLYPSEKSYRTMEKEYLQFYWKKKYNLSKHFYSSGSIQMFIKTSSHKMFENDCHALSP
jgi:hypothetical protein